MKKLLHAMFEVYVQTMDVKSTKRSLLNFFVSLDEIDQVWDVYFTEFQESVSLNYVSACRDLYKGALFIAESCISFSYKFPFLNEPESQKLTFMFERAMLVAQVIHQHDFEKEREELPKEGSQGESLENQKFQKTIDQATRIFYSIANAAS